MAVPIPSTPSTLFSNRVVNNKIQPYSNLIKVLLKKRLRHMFTISGFTTYSILLLVVFDPTALPGSLFNFLSVLLYAPLAFLGALPIFILRKQRLTTISKNYPSRFARFLAVFTPSTLSIFLTYLLASIPICIAYLYCTSAVSNDPKLGLLFFHSGREFQQVNERRVLLTLLHLFLVGFATFQHAYSERSLVKFDTDSTLSIPARLSSTALARIPLLIRSVLVSNVTFYSLYLLLRPIVSQIFFRHIAAVWSRPYLYALYHENAALSITLATRAIASSILTLVVWESAHICFNVYATHPMTVSQFAPNPNQSLIAGLNSPEDYFRHFAFLELALISSSNPERRKNIFMEIKRDTPEVGAWSEISKECLKVVEEGMDLVQRRGQKPQLTAPPTSKSSTPFPGAIKPVNSNVFLPVKKSIFDTLSSATAGAPPTVPVAISSAISSSTTALVSRVPSIFQSSRESALTEVTLPKPNEVVKLEASLEDWIPASLRGSAFRFVFGKRPLATVNICVARKVEVIWAIRALSNFLVVSITEDPYGVAQSHLPRILESFILYLTALENLSVALESSATEVDKKEMKLVIEENVAPIETALREGCRALMDVFKKYEGNGLDLPPTVASKLKVLVDWG